MHYLLLFVWFGQGGVQDKSLSSVFIFIFSQNTNNTESDLFHSDLGDSQTTLELSNKSELSNCRVIEPKRLPLPS